MNPIYFESPAFRKLLTDVGPFQCLDIGARGEGFADLETIGGAIELIGFEPDGNECERLNRNPDPVLSKYRSARFLPVALGARKATAQLYLARHGGASSLLRPVSNIKGRFYATDDLFDVVDEVPVNVEALDTVCAENSLNRVAFMKIDVEGYELEVFHGAKELLSTTLLGIRSEVAFLPVREWQPTYCELLEHLKGYGFIPMDFLFLHHWRAKTKHIQRRLSSADLGVYRRQLVHGDALFFRDPETIDAGSENGIRLLMRESALMYAYGFFDQATAILERPEVDDFLQQHLGFSSARVASEVEVDYRKQQHENWLKSMMRKLRTAW